MASMRVEAYIATLSWDLAPGTNAVKLQKAFDDFINQPNGMMLRTTFLLEPVLNKWLQLLIMPGKKKMEWKTITVTDEVELDLRVSEYEQTRGTARFDEGGLLTRACIFQLNGYARVIVWSLHHALTDHWTLEQAMSDIQCIYVNRPFPQRRPFKPMIKYLQGLDRSSGIEFWKKHLHNAFPTPFPQGRSNIHRVAADGVIIRSIDIDYNSLTHCFGIMPSTLITCAWSTVLSAHSGITDVVFGQVLAGRSV